MIRSNAVWRNGPGYLLTRLCARCSSSQQIAAKTTVPSYGGDTVLWSVIGERVRITGLRKSGS